MVEEEEQQQGNTTPRSTIYPLEVSTNHQTRDRQGVGQSATVEAMEVAS